jgi:sigma-B regulation protein RsbU (phosphoserine phosphatase)
MLASARYMEGTEDLAPGDLLVAYSDGLTEACNEAGEEFGVERLERLLPALREHDPETTGTMILKNLDEFLGPARLSDDLSLVIIARQ